MFWSVRVGKKGKEKKRKIIRRICVWRGKKWKKKRKKKGNMDEKKESKEIREK